MLQRLDTPLVVLTVRRVTFMMVDSLSEVGLGSGREGDGAHVLCHDNLSL